MKYLTVGILWLCTSIAPAGEIADLYQKAEKDGTVKRGKPIDRQDDHPNNAGVTEIGIERSPCYGMCPVYTFVVKSDGTLRYHGGQHVGRKGEFTGRINPWQFAKLAAFIKESAYADLDDEYTTGVTDSATVYTTAVIDGKRKLVSDYASAGPAKLWAVEKLIDAVMADAEWDAKPAAATQPVARPNP